jgi:hypothetical protein
MPHSTSGKYCFNRKEFSYFSIRIVGKATVFFWILDNLVYHMSYTCDTKAIQNSTELPLSSCLFGIKLGRFTSIQNVGTFHRLSWVGQPISSLLHT